MKRLIVKDDFLSKLRRYFNLNLYEVKIWTALLSRGVSTAGELSDIANVPRSRSYDVLESLEKKGFVIMKLGKPIKYIAVPPTEVVERVKKKIKREAKEEEAIIEELRKSQVLKDLNQLHDQGIETQDPTELTGSLRSRENIYTHLEYQLKIAKNSVFIVTTEDGLQRKAKALAKQIKKAKARGVKVVIAAPLTAKTKDAQKILSENAILKNIDSPNKRFCIMDEEQVTIMLTDDKEVHPSYDLAVWLHTPYFAKTLLSSI